MKVTFKAKPVPVRYLGEDHPRRMITVPKLTRRHVDMTQARSDPVFGPYANSDMFEQIVNTAVRRVIPTGRIDLDAPPPGVEVDATGFLRTVSIEIHHWRRQPATPPRESGR